MKNDGETHLKESQINFIKNEIQQDLNEHEKG
jgi:hypothetical protein